MSNDKQTTEPMVISQTSSTKTAQGIYVQDIKKEVTMSNNKQSSVEWLYEKMFVNHGRITIEEFEQAKAMHETEHFNTWRHEISENEPISFKQYYNEIFGE